MSRARITGHFGAKAVKTKTKPNHFVSRSIGVLKTNKAVGLDKIGARLRKDSVDVITPSLTNLEIIVNFNKILETLIFQRSYAQYLY